VVSFIGLTVHWAVKDGIQSTILDFVKCVIHALSFQLCKTQRLLFYSRAPKGHTGSYLAGRISETLHEFGIQDKVSDCFRNHRER
jgi:hypothetical protein